MPAAQTTLEKLLYEVTHSLCSGKLENILELLVIHSIPVAMVFRKKQLVFAQLEQSPVSGRFQ